MKRKTNNELMNPQNGSHQQDIWNEAGRLIRKTEMVSILMFKPLEVLNPDNACTNIG